ncbi:HET-like protein [Alternaria alternata]|nr:HET-like protein [Alternaria alternata]
MKLVSALTCALLATVAQANYRCRCTPAGRVNNISDDCCGSRITLSDGTRVTGNVESGGFCAYYTSGWSTAEFSNSAESRLDSRSNMISASLDDGKEEGSCVKDREVMRGPPEDPFGNLHFREETLNRLGLCLADLRLKANAGCDFSQYLKDNIEDRMNIDADPDAIQLYIRLEDYPRILIEPLICLQGLHLSDDIFGGKDVSRCFVTAASKGNRLWISCFLSDTSGPLDQLQLKIVCGDDMGEHDMSRYVALSYCWGGDQPSKLTQKNHDLYKKSIAWKTLPKTIQDAAKTVQALGFHYLWIDSMCIVQDSKEDKKAEISQMTKVYAHATLTVVNQRGDQVTEGFLHPRILPFGTSSIQYRAEDGRTQRLTLTFNTAAYREESFAVNTRGWTLQEYLLSRRRLVIGTWSTEWLCRREAHDHRDGWVLSSREGLPFESEGTGWAGKGPFGSKEAESVYRSSFINAAMFFSVNPGYPSGQLNEELVRESWYTVVQSYSLRSVTESEDRILALSGIAERFADLIPGRYIAGIWENMMPSCLFWYKIGRPVDRPVKYRGPSWSWMSIDGKVEHTRSDNCVCEIPSVEYMLENAEALYGAVRNATLHIKGPALSVEWRYTRQDGQRQEDLSEFRWSREGSDDAQDPQLEVTIDAREKTTEWREAILLAYNLSKHGLNLRDTWCIALTKVDQVEVDKKPRRRFRRLGSVSFWESSPLPHVESWPVSSYYII